MVAHDPIIAYLLDEHVVDTASIDGLIEKQRTTGQSLISLIKSQGLVSEEQFTKLIARANKIEYISLTPDMVDPMAARLLTYDMVNQNNLLPIKLEKETLTVAMSSPMNLAIREQIEVRTGYKVMPVAAAIGDIRQAIQCHFDVRNVTRQDIVSMRVKRAPSAQPEVKTRYEVGKASNAPVTRLVASIINGAIDARASDIHIEPQEPDIKVRYRVDGILRDAIEVPASVQREVVSHIKILADMDISERRIPQDGHIAVAFGGNDYDLRVSTLPAVGGEKIVIRILDKRCGRRCLDEIVLSPNDNAAMRGLITNPGGMLLVTGPTASGKTTTLYALLDELNTPERNLITVEDPVEHRLPGTTQVQVKSGVGVTFSSALRAILRQDPNVIFIGEIRDLETAEIAIRASLTGHFVLSTLHTNDAAGAIVRLIDIGIAPFLVASSLVGTVAQRLVRTICPNCRSAYEPDATDVEILSMEKGSLPKTLYRGGGCAACFNAGYKGREAIYEILPISATIRKQIVNGASDDQIKAQALAEGMRTLRGSGVDAVLQGHTTTAELARVIDLRK